MIVGATSGASDMAFSTVRTGEIAVIRATASVAAARDGAAPVSVTVRPSTSPDAQPRPPAVSVALTCAV